MIIMEESNKKIVCIVRLKHINFFLKQGFSKYFKVIGFDVNEN